MRNSLFRLYFKEIAINFSFMIISECFSAYYNYLVGDLISFLKYDSIEETDTKVVLFSTIEVTSH